jgi:hypothetical protein
MIAGTFVAAPDPQRTILPAFPARLEIVYLFLILLGPFDPRLPFTGVSGIYLTTQVTIRERIKSPVGITLFFPVILSNPRFQIDRGVGLSDLIPQTHKEEIQPVVVAQPPPSLKCFRH